MAYLVRAPGNRNPLTEEAARLEVLAAKKKLSGWERGELHALAIGAVRHPGAPAARASDQGPADVVNGIIDALPGVQAVDEERATVEADWQAYLEWKNEQAARYQREVEDHRAAVRRAIENREDPPSAPVPPGLEDEHARRLVQHRADMDRLDRARYRAIADAAEAVHEAATAETGAAVEEARPLLEALNEILARVRSAQEATREVLVAQDLRRGVRNLARSGPQRADLAALADAVSSVETCCTSVRKAGSSSTAGKTTGSTRRARPRRLGMAASNVRQVPDTSDWAPRDGSWHPTR